MSSLTPTSIKMKILPWDKLGVIEGTIWESVNKLESDDSKKNDLNWEKLEKEFKIEERKKGMKVYLFESALDLFFIYIHHSCDLSKMSNAAV